MPMAWKAARYGEDRDEEGWGGNRNTFIDQISWYPRTESGVDGPFSTYLIIKIHLQVVLAAIAPPTIGPTRRAKALTMAIFAAICAYFSDGTRSISMIWHRANEPPPPIPWKARSTILLNVSSISWLVIYNWPALQLCQGLGGSTSGGEDDEDSSGQQEDGFPPEYVTEFGEDNDDGYRGL